MHAGAAAVGLLGVPIGIPFVPVPVLAEETSAGVRLRPYLVLGGLKGSRQLSAYPAWFVCSFVACVGLCFYTVAWTGGERRTVTAIC